MGLPLDAQLGKLGRLLWEESKPVQLILGCLSGSFVKSQVRGLSVKSLSSPNQGKVNTITSI